MLSLPHGCRTGKISVTPANWKEPEASLDQDWLVHYRFHDPNFADKYPKGYPVQFRGMNDAKTLATRRRVTQGLIDDDRQRLQNGWNPILKKTVALNEYEISPDTPFISALEGALKLLPPSRSSNEVRKALAHIGPSIQQLHYERLPIGEVRRRHVKAVLDKISANRKQATGKEWGAPSFNHYRSYLDMLFDQLQELEATEIDPVAKIKKKRTTKKDRLVLSDEDLQEVYKHVRDRQYTLWRFIHLFFQSGSRMSEIMDVRRRDVDLRNKRFKVTVRKGGGQIEEVWKTITATAFPVWEEVAREGRLAAHGQRGRSGSEISCLLPSPAGLDPNDFLFSYELRPGAVPISERQVTDRWRKHVKKKLSIEADFYSLKKKFTTEVVSAALQEIEAAQQVAADHNNHKGTAMVKKHYDGESKERLHRKLRVV